jgi:hypothetical protein
MVPEVLRIDLRDDERDAIGHAPGVALIDHDSAGFSGDRRPMAADLVIDGDEREIDTPECFGSNGADGELLAFEGDGLALGALGSEGAELADREGALFEDVNKELADQARGAKYGNVY